MDKNDNKTASNNYNFSLASAADEVSAKIINKEADIVAAPTNLAAVLYKKTEGNVVMLAANTLGNLYIVTKNAEVSSIADLKGKTIYSSGQGASPEYVLNFLLKENGIDPEKDVETKNRLLKDCIERITYNREKPERIRNTEKRTKDNGRPDGKGRWLKPNPLKTGAMWTNPPIDIDVKLKV
jgi:choline kinase